MKRVSWSNVFVGVFLVWVGAYCSSGCATAQPRTPEYTGLVLSEEVIQGMFEIQDQYDHETVKCLTGFVRADTVVVTGMTPTWLNWADSVSAVFRACADPSSVGYYHNHPIIVEPACWIEGDDVRTLNAIPAFQVAVITCDDLMLVWLFKYQDMSHGHRFADSYRIKGRGGH